MSKARAKCAVCLRAMPAGNENGRPRVYCSVGCRRESEHCAARSRKRLEKLESERLLCLRVVDADPAAPIDHPDLGRMAPAKALANVEHAIALEFVRLHAITAANETTADFREQLAPGAS